MGGTRRLSYQADGEQPWRRESVGHEDEAQSPDRDGGPEYAVQAAGSLVAHQQRRGHGVGVDEAGVGPLRGRRRTADQGPSPRSTETRDPGSLTMIPSVRKRMAPPRAWTMKKEGG